MQKILDICRRAGSLIGFLFLQVLGRDRFYIFAQKNGFFPKLCRVFAYDPHVKKIILGFDEISRDKDLSRQSTTSITQYSDASLCGYGTDVIAQADQHNPLEEQLRGIIFNYIDNEVRKAPPPPIRSICEIGTGNGDVAHYLSTKYKDIEIIAIDFNVDNAQNNHSNNNLTFIEGYALDLFDNGDISADLVFGSSTFVVLAPKELDNYITTFKKSGVKELLVSEPLTRKYNPAKHPTPLSIHMAKGMWGHNYAGYFKKHDLELLVNDVVEYKKHKKRETIYFNVAGCKF